MTISQEPLVEIDPTSCQNISCMKPFCFLQYGIPRWSPFAVTKNRTERKNDSGTLVFKIVKKKKKSTAELGHNDILSVLQVQFR